MPKRSGKAGCQTTAQRPCLAQLLVDERLPEYRQALAAILAGMIYRVEPIVDHRLTQAGERFRRQTTRHLQLFLVGKEKAFGERLRLLLEGFLFRREREVHGSTPSSI